MLKPPPATYPEYFQRYVNQVPEENLYTAFANQLPVIRKFLDAVTEERSTYAYAEGKWTLKEVLQHIIDAERIFCYRALCFARKESQSLPGFDENDYAVNSNANDRTWLSLADEFLALRRTTEILFETFNRETLQATGTANNRPASVISTGFIILGHFYHHKKVVDERYM